MRVDSHQHYWKPERGDYGFLTPEAGILYREYLPDHLRPHLAYKGFDKTIVVQAAPTLEETRYLLVLAENDPSIAGVVGWLDFESSNFEEELARFMNNPLFVGVRPMLQEHPPEYLRKPIVQRNIGIVADSGIVLDWLVYPRHLTAVYETMKEFPHLKGVIDHLAKPDIRNSSLEPWKQQMARLSAFPHLACKISGLVTEAEPDNLFPSTYIPYVSHVLEHFGEDRVMFGSDWPVCLLAASYEAVMDLMEAVIPAEWTEVQRNKFFGGNAIRWYGLPLGG
jgi:L-fuconolactonase